MVNLHCGPQGTGNPNEKSLGAALKIHGVPKRKAWTRPARGRLSRKCLPGSQQHHQHKVEAVPERIFIDLVPIATARHRSKKHNTMTADNTIKVEAFHLKTSKSPWVLLRKAAGSTKLPSMKRFRMVLTTGSSEELWLAGSVFSNKATDFIAACRPDCSSHLRINSEFIWYGLPWLTRFGSCHSSWLWLYNKDRY